MSNPTESVRALLAHADSNRELAERWEADAWKLALEKIVEGVQDPVGLARLALRIRPTNGASECPFTPDDELPF